MARKMPKKARLGFDGVDVDFLGSRDESPEERTVESRKRLRDMLNAQVQEFIESGGEITNVETNSTVDAGYNAVKKSYNDQSL